MAETELRIRLNEWMTNALYHLSRRIGMDYTNITRMALMEYLEKRLQPLDYDQITLSEQLNLKDLIFEFEHYNRIIKKYPEKRANNFKKLFIVALQNYIKQKHTYFKNYKTDIPRFSEMIWKEPGVIDLLDFVIELNEIPFPEKDQYEHLLKKGKKDEYYNKIWNELYDNLKDKIGRKKHENYVRLIEMKIDHHLVTDTDAMYFLFEKLKNNEPLPPSSGQETKRIRNISGVDEGQLEGVIKKYGVNFDFINKEELQDIRQKYGELEQIDVMINYHQGVIDHEKNYMDKTRVDFARDELKKWKKIKKEFMQEHKKNVKKK